MSEQTDTSLRIIAEIVEGLLMLTPAERGTVAKEFAEAVRRWLMSLPR